MYWDGEKPFKIAIQKQVYFLYESLKITFFMKPMDSEQN